MAMKLNQTAGLLLVFLVCGFQVKTGDGHGRLIEPPNRSSLWRLKEFDNLDPPVPVNYDDDQLYCGAIGKMVSNGGKCGVCGDDWESWSPRENENGGKYGRGIVVRDYNVGQVIDIAVDITTSHWGYFEFRICPLPNPKDPEADDCFDKYLLELGDNSGTRYNLTSDKPGWYNMTVRLPENLKCERCVLQWHYRAGNTWNFCGDDEFRGNVVCGYQETFRGCADISIGGAEIADQQNGSSRPRPVHFHKTTTANYYDKEFAKLTSTMEPTTTRLPSLVGSNLIGSNKRAFPTMRPPMSLQGPRRS